MSDQANILDYLELSRNAWDEKDYIRAAICAYWCVQYCRYGEPYGMSGSRLRNSESEAWNIYRKSIKKFKSSLLSKTTFVYGTICPKLLWLYKNKYNLRVISTETQKKFDGGHNIGSLAQKLFPDGIDASNYDGIAERIIDMSRMELPFNIKQQLWIDKTNKLYRDHTVYEAAFIYNDVFAAVDILTKGRKGHAAYEVKSSKGITDTFIKDCALQYYVINKNCPLEDFFLIYLNESYLEEIKIPLDEINDTNADINKLFVKESVLSKILPLQKDIENEVKMCKSILKKGEPDIKMGEQCSFPYDCMYKKYCQSKSIIDFDWY